MMKRVLFVVAVVGLVMCSRLPRPGAIVVHAQSLPVTKTVAWDANAAADAVTNYVVALDAVTVGSPIGTTQPVTFTTAGTHTITVRAVNIWGTSSPATLTVNVVVPGAPGNLRLQ